MRKRNLFILFLWLSGIVAGMQFAKFSSTIGLIQTEVGIDPLYSGWLLSSLGIIGIIFGVTSGVIVSRFSPLKMVVAFLWWAAVSSLLPLILIQYTFCTMIGLCVLIIFNSGAIFFLVAASAILTCAGVLQGAIYATFNHTRLCQWYHYTNG